MPPITNRRGMTMPRMSKLEKIKTRHCPKCLCPTERYENGRCKPCHLKYSLKWKVENIERVKIKNKERNISKVEEICAYHANYYLRKKESICLASNLWKAKNPERVRNVNVAWNEANKDRKRIHNQNRRSRKNARPGNLSKNIFSKLVKLQKNKCACCLADISGLTAHLDHIVPLALGGEHADFNMQILCATCNLKKGAKKPHEFMQSQGFLL